MVERAWVNMGYFFHHKDHSKKYSVVYYKVSLNIAQSAWAVKYTDCTSAHSTLPQTSVLDMTLNNPMVKF